MEKPIENLCEGYDPERDISGSAGGAYGHYLADKLIEKKEIENLEKEKELEKKFEFIKKVDGMGINPDSIFLNRDIKENLIREYKGYTKLNREGQNHNKGEKGDYLLHCSDAKIGLVFRDIYRSFSKALGK